MNTFSEYDHFDGLGLAELVRTKKVQAIELCEEAIRRAEAINPLVNAIILPLYDMARAQAKGPLPDSPFSGVPFLLKDAHHTLKGVAMSHGSEAFKGSLSKKDAEIVKRFKNAGVVILGKTNTPEFKLATVTEPKAFGPTRNPWNPRYSSGGSSGGSAAAVAAGIVPLASGTDEGGSIRIPSSYCGLFGLKPSRGRNPVGPNFGEEWDGMSTSHVLTRSVRDSAAMLDATAGPAESGAPYTITAPARPYLEEVNLEPGRFRIAYNTRGAYRKDVHPECKKAVERTAQLLESLGHHVEEAAPDYQEEDVVMNWCMVMFGNMAVRMEEIIQLHGSTGARSKVELQNYALYKFGRSLNAAEFIKAKLKWRELGMTMSEFLQKYDMILTPTLGEPPVLVGSQQPRKADQIFMKLAGSLVGTLILASQKITQPIVKEVVKNVMKGQLPFTFIANMTGQPAMSVPLHWTEEGLPCGVQFIARFGDEASLFRLASQLEKAQPWFEKRPVIKSL